MKPLIQILTEYEGVIQDDEDEHSEESAQRLELARNNLLEILKIARAWEEGTPICHREAT